MTMTLRSTARGKYHLMYHRSRRARYRGVANCGYGGFITNVDSEHPVVKQLLCKHCLRGPSNRIVKIFEGVRVPQ